MAISVNSRVVPLYLPESGTISIAVITTPGAFAALRSEWNELIANSNASIFNGWSWLYPWYRQLGNEREPFILTARSATGRLLGLLPLCVEQRRMGPLPLRRLSFLGETHVGSDYLDVIARHEYEDTVRLHFASYLIERRADWHVLDLLDMDEASPTLDVFSAMLGGAGFAVEQRDCATCPHEPLAEVTCFDTFLRGTGRRDNFLRRSKWLQKQPGYSLDRSETPDEASAALGDFLRLHHLRWASDGGSQGIRGPRSEAFHHEAVRWLAEDGNIRFYTLRVGDEAVASVYGMRDGDKFVYYQSGYDPAWSSKSVGMVLVGETFRDAIASGRREYDFLRGTEAYKSDWTTQKRRTVALRSYCPHGRGRLLGQQQRATLSLRAAAKRALPDGLVSRVQRIERKREG